MTNDLAEGEAADPGTVSPVETMTAGTSIPSRRSWLIAGILAVVLVAGGVVGWRVWITRTDTVSLAELRSAYGDLSEPGWSAANDLHFPPGAANSARTRTVPAECSVLLDTAGQQRWPAGAIDGSGQEREFEDGQAMVFSFRYLDRRTARTAFDQLSDTLDHCHSFRISIDSASVEFRVEPLSGTVDDADAIPTMLITVSNASVSAEVSVVRYANVISWGVTNLDSTIDASDQTAVPGQDRLSTLSAALVAADHISG